MQLLLPLAQELGFDQGVCLGHGLSSHFVPVLLHKPELPGGANLAGGRQPEAARPCAEAN